MDSLLIFFSPDETSRKCFKSGIEFLNQYLKSAESKNLKKLLGNEFGALYFTEVQPNFSLEDLTARLTEAGFNTENIQLIHKPQSQKKFKFPELNKVRKSETESNLCLSFLLA